MPEACEARAIGGVHERLSDATVGIVRFKDDELVDDIFELKKADLQKESLSSSNPNGKTSTIFNGTLRRPAHFGALHVGGRCSAEGR